MAAFAKKSNIDNQKCFQCNGCGIIANKFGKKYDNHGRSCGDKCPGCDGTGAIPADSIACPKCKGIGRTQDTWGKIWDRRGWPCGNKCNTCDAKGYIKGPSQNTLIATSNIKNIIIGYHQTKNDRTTINSILKNGFICGRSGMAGGGIYFALQPEDTVGKAHQGGYMFKCNVDIGCAKIVQKTCPNTNLESLKREGYDSVFIPGGIHSPVSRDEYVVFEPNRVTIISHGICNSSTGK